MKRIWIANSHGACSFFASLSFFPPVHPPLRGTDNIGRGIISKHFSKWHMAKNLLESEGSQVLGDNTECCYIDYFYCYPIVVDPQDELPPAGSGSPRSLSLGEQCALLKIHKKQTSTISSASEKSSLMGCY